MKCPHCGLFNPDEAERCDCGYDFVKKTVEQPYFQQPPKQKTGLATASLICGICGLAYPTSLFWLSSQNRGEAEPE